MTAKKDLKRRVRERQAKTGESYTAARAHVVAGAPAKQVPFDVEELVTLEQAASLGYQCTVLASSKLLAAVDANRVLVRIRDALLATENDPAMQRLRALVFRGERIRRSVQPGPAWWGELRQFMTRVHAGIGGFHERSDLLALHVDGVMVLAHGAMGRPVGEHLLVAFPRSAPRLFLSLVDTAMMNSAFSLLMR
jgi:hypothetical protein